MKPLSYPPAQAGRQRVRPFCEPRLDGSSNSRVRNENGCVNPAQIVDRTCWAPMTSIGFRDMLAPENPKEERDRNLQEWRVVEIEGVGRNEKAA